MKPDTETMPLAPTVANSSTAPTSSGGPRAVATGAFSLDALNAARYERGRVLARGGMGEVQLAEDTRIGREVALKLLRDGPAASSDAVARFVREARVQGQLEHPAIVPVHDLGIGADGAPYFTMKRLRGQTLQQILDGQRGGDAQVSRRRLLTHFASACQAIEFAHSRGVLHRDLKPTNLMLGDFGEVYVLDWGVAKLAGVTDPAGGGDAARASLVGSTQQGAVLGTPGYMAPEQLRGEVEALDGRADVYALGAILFEILTLRPLHERTSHDAVVKSTLAGRSARSDDLPPELEAICVRATALAPADRYPTVKALLDDLERYLEGDRDLEARRLAAASHAALARAAADRATAVSGGTDDGPARAEALREAGRALAFDPANLEALRTLTRLLVEPPRSTPPEVERMVQASIGASAREEARVGAWAYLATLAAFPLFVWMGIRDWPMAVVVFGLLAVHGATAFVFSRFDRVPASWMYVVMVANAVWVALSSRLFGPFLVAPSVAVISAASFIMHAHLKPWIVIALACLSIAAPILLEVAGVIPATTHFTGHAIVIVPALVRFPATPAFVVLFVSSIGVIIPSAVALARVHRAQLAAERRMHLQSWQLGQLVPAEARPRVTA